MGTGVRGVVIIGEGVDRGVACGGVRIGAGRMGIELVLS